MESAFLNIPLHSLIPVGSLAQVPAWGCLVVSNLFQRHFNTHGKEDTHFMDNGYPKTVQESQCVDKSNVSVHPCIYNPLYRVY